ncbi:MAG TPA: PilZ domain-containing protein [Stellaceae bacterium]|nr:PilZ domain-containing protein [Stellaceae bacterium]
MAAAALSSATAHKDPRERRKHLRKETLWHCTLRTAQGSVAWRVLNLSVRGAKIETTGVAKGDSVTLVMEPLGEFLGIVAWQRDGRAGIHINEHRTTRVEITLPRSLSGEAFMAER